MLAWVGSGQFYALTGEGRTIAWGEEPIWFPHEATRFAGEDGMPGRFLSYHNAHASLFEYYHSPERKDGPGRTVYTDPRLEVAGAELFSEYQKLGKRIAEDEPGWEGELDRIGRPSIMVDHELNARIGASLLASRHWKCVWFDPIVAVFVHDSGTQGGRGARGRFRGSPFPARRGPPSLTAPAALRRRGERGAQLSEFLDRPGRARPAAGLAGPGLRAAAASRPTPSRWRAGKPWGRSRLLRDPPGQPSPRFRMTFDPVFDLALVRATYAFRRAREIAPAIS